MSERRDKLTDVRRVTPMADEREWTLRHATDGALCAWEHNDGLPGVVVVPKSTREAAEAEVERLREALKLARALIDSEVDNATEAALNADRAASVIDAALSPREDA